MSDKLRRGINNYKKVLIIFLLFALLFTSGCWNYVEINKATVALGLALDLQGNQPSFSVQLAQPSNSGATGVASQQPVNITATGRSFSEAARRTMLILPRLPGWAHASTIIIGQALAYNDLALVADLLARNRYIRGSALLFVYGGERASDCLESQVPLEPFSLPGLRKIIETQESQLGIYTPVNLKEFIEKLATAGVEPIMPRVVTREEKGKKILQLEGIAVFKGRKIVGCLDEKESRGYRFLRPKINTGGLIIIPWLQGEGETVGQQIITLELAHSQVQFKPQWAEDKLQMEIEIEAEGNFYEQNFPNNILTPEMIKEIEEQANKEIAAQINASINKAQTLKSDIFGWGQLIQQKKPALWEELKQYWPETFANIDTNIKVKFQIRRTYFLDKSFRFM